jgi:hypothetical protein
VTEQPPRSHVSDAKRRYRRAWWTGLVLSALAHAVLFFWAAQELRLRAARYDSIPQIVRSPEGMQVIEVRPIAPEEVVAPDERRLIQLPPEPEEQAPIPEREATPTGVPVPVAGGREDDEGLGMSNAEKLQPHEGDERLWKDFEREKMPEYVQSRWARAEGAIRARLGQLLDSLDLTEEQRRKATDWLTGESDEEWGVTPDGLVLGGLVIPMNVGAMFAEEGPNGRESRAALRDLELIRRQDMMSDIDETMEERNESIEQRMAVERARQAVIDSLAAADSALSQGSAGGPNP